MPLMALEPDSNAVIRSGATPYLFTLFKQSNCLELAKIQGLHEMHLGTTLKCKLTA